MPKLVADNGHVWHLFRGRYRAYGLSSLMMGASNNILPSQSNYSTVDMQLSSHDIRNSLEHEHITCHAPISLWDAQSVLVSKEDLEVTPQALQ